MKSDFSYRARREITDITGNQVTLAYHGPKHSERQSVIEIIKKDGPKDRKPVDFRIGLFELRHKNIVPYVGFVETATHFGIAAERTYGTYGAGAAGQ